MPEAMELFGALLQGQMPSRVPVAVNMLDQGGKELGLSPQEYYDKADNIVEGQLALRKKYGHDVLWGAHYVARQAEILGSKRTIFAPNGPPNVGDLVIRTYEDIEKLVIPKHIEDHPSFAIQAESIAKLVKEVGDTVPVCAFVAGSFSLPAILMGSDAWMEMILFGPKSLRDELLTKCSDYTIETFKAFQRAGAAMIAYSNPFASVEILPFKTIEEMAFPWVKRDIDGCGAPGFIYFNGGGRINPTIPGLIEQAGVGAFYIHPDDSITEAKTLAAGRALIAGSINDIPLVHLSAAEVKQQVKDIMAAGAPGGGFIFGTLVMPYDIPDENIHAIIEAAHQYGAYSGVS